jgi:nitrate reductase NapE component
MTRILVILVGIFGLSQFAEACAVCAPGTEESRFAFILTTVILSLVPLAMIGGGGYLVYKRYQSPESNHDEI